VFCVCFVYVSVCFCFTLIPEASYGFTDGLGGTCIVRKKCSLHVAASYGAGRDLGGNMYMFCMGSMYMFCVRCFVYVRTEKREKK
jgi:hypothetical protein